MRQRDPIIWAFALASFLFCGAVSAATWSLPPAIMGMLPIPVVFMAFAGSSLGILWQPPAAVGRLMMLLTTICFTFVVTCITVIAPHVPGLGWMHDVLPAVAGVSSFFSQKLVPALGRRFENTISGRGATDEGAKP